MQKSIVAIYLAIMILLGLALRGRINNISDFLIAGRNLGILLTTATFAGIQLGTMFGVSFEIGVWSIDGVVLIYSMLGGMWGAVSTDLVQVSVIVVAIPGLAFFWRKIMTNPSGSKASCPYLI